ncbi:MAG: indole-3-glycerol-phosphate synthase TrpC, partial [Ruminococcus sp.]|nr:indole-3-glycerol-phosphate synthase TrpC [Ruminococcus sp.]
MTILDKLAGYAKERVEISKQKVSADDMKTMALSMPSGNFEFEKALSGDDISFICECKKASPSKGI